MKDIRSASSNALPTVAGVAALLLVLGFAAWQTISTGVLSNLDLARPEVGQARELTQRADGANAEGLAIYRQSEHSAASSRENAQGLTIYRMSERAGEIMSQIPAVAMEIYWQSERSGGSSAEFTSNAQGLAIYHASERGR